MLLVIDNFDSFTFNIVQYFGQLGWKPEVYRNHELNGEQVVAMHPQMVVISPGPCSPKEAGNSLGIIGAVSKARIPLFGVCLGHQCIGDYFGGDIVRADRLMHGKTSPIHHHATDIFADLPTPFPATRYHSLLVKRETFPDVLEITAETETGEIMGLRHRELPIWGVQFHPESMATEHGHKMLQNFLHLAEKHAAPASA
ncbi:MAG: anthranilate synthase component II [Puniceicoccaceae bacterium 5H]|nr:MAG: anthranilate synthase component II [Puniceicoccaceae bacterium 5H]